MERFFKKITYKTTLNYNYYRPQIGRNEYFKYISSMSYFHKNKEIIKGEKILETEPIHPLIIDDSWDIIVKVTDRNAWLSKIINEKKCTAEEAIELMKTEISDSIKLRPKIHEEMGQFPFDLFRPK